MNARTYATYRRLMQVEQAWKQGASPRVSSEVINLRDELASKDMAYNQISMKCQELGIPAPRVGGDEYPSDERPKKKKKSSTKSTTKSVTEIVVEDHHDH
jgi:hypothetical protein